MLHNVSPRKLIFLAAGPFIADAMAIMVVCAMSVHAVAHMGMPPKLVGWIGATYSLAYAVTAHYAGRWVKAHWAMTVLMIAIPAAAFFGTVASLVRGMVPFIAASAMTGVAVGHYFAPFQIKMGKVKPFTTLAWTVGFYNICWSSGFAGGAFAGSFLQSLDPAWLISAAWALVVAHTVIALLANADRSPDNKEYHPSESFSSTATLRRCGWLGIFVGMFLLNGAMYTLWPALAKSAHISDIDIAFGMLALAAPIPLTALVWPRLREAARRPWMIVWLLGAISTGFVLLPLTPWPWTMLPLALVGMGGGGLFFHTVYYSNGDIENPGQSIGMNELVVGLGGVVGPPCLGLLAGSDAVSARPYIFGATLAAFAAAAIPILWRLTRKNEKRLVP